MLAPNLDLIQRTCDGEEYVEPLKQRVVGQRFGEGGAAAVTKFGHALTTHGGELLELALLLRFVLDVLLEGWWGGWVGWWGQCS